MEELLCEDGGVAMWGWRSGYVRMKEWLCEDGVVVLYGPARIASRERTTTKRGLQGETPKLQV